MAKARPGVKLQTKRLSRATARFQRVTAWILPKPPRAKVKPMNEPRWRTAHSSSWTDALEQTRPRQLQILSQASASLSPSTSNDDRIYLSFWWFIQASWSLFSHTSHARFVKSGILLNSCPLSCSLLKHVLKEKHLDQLPLLQKRSWPGERSSAHICLMKMLG